MTAFDQMLYRLGPPEGGQVDLLAASIEPTSLARRWQVVLEPWLRVGLPGSRAYLLFGPMAVAIRWMPGNDGSADEYVHAIIGSIENLSPGLALSQPAWDWSIQQLRFGRLGSDQLAMVGTEELEQLAHSGPVAEQLVPLIAQILAGQTAPILPATGGGVRPEAVLWGLRDILRALDFGPTWSFMTGARSPCPSLPGLLVTFRPGQPAVWPGSPYRDVAATLFARYAEIGGTELRALLANQPADGPGDSAAQMRRLIELWPWVAVSAKDQPTGEDMTQIIDGGVCCPICLSRFAWNEQALWQWDEASRDYVELKFQPTDSRERRNRESRNSSVRCPNYGGQKDKAHYLPADYGRYGAPTIIGFIGASTTGKSHLLAAMVGSIERGDLHQYGISARPVDRQLHQTYMTDKVRPLFDEHKPVTATATGGISFVDAFILRQGNGPDRPVALFDVAGEDLASAPESKNFLELVDGLIFVVDPSQLRGDLGDRAFSAVLGHISRSGRLSQVSASIVINKADIVRFDDPIAWWLRADAIGLDPESVVAESADAYAYLISRGAQAWLRPYNECTKATLHIASPTGGADHHNTFVRGVRPCRVLRPLVAVLAMTGVLTGPQAEKVGI